MARYLKIVFLGLYLVLAYMGRLISSVSDNFNKFRFGSANYTTCFWHNRKLKQNLCLRAFSIVIYESSVLTTFLVNRLFKSDL